MGRWREKLIHAVQTENAQSQRRGRETCTKAAAMDPEDNTATHGAYHQEQHTLAKITLLAHAKVPAMHAPAL